MVTMAVSTVSVIESIIVMRLCSLQATTMSSFIRFIAFRLIGRALCITRSSAKHREDRDGRNTKRQVKSDVEESLLGDTQTSNVVKGSSELTHQINDVLVELRKVRPALLHCRETADQT